MRFKSVLTCRLIRRDRNQLYCICISYLLGIAIAGDAPYRNQNARQLRLVRVMNAMPIRQGPPFLAVVRIKGITGHLGC